LHHNDIAAVSCVNINIPRLLVPYAPAAVTGAGELVWIVPGATDATNEELTVPLTEEVLTGNKGWET
jgi:hypothetical protein